MIWAVIQKTTDSVHNVTGLVRIKNEGTILGFQDFIYAFKKLCDMAPDNTPITDCYIVEIFNDTEIDGTSIVLDTVQIRDCVCYREIKEIQSNILQVITHQVNSNIRPTFDVGFTMSWEGGVYDAQYRITESRDLLPWLLTNKKQSAQGYMSIRDVLTSCCASDSADCRRMFIWLKRDWEYSNFIKWETLNKMWEEGNPLWYTKWTYPQLGLDYPKEVYHRGKMSSSLRLALCAQKLPNPYRYYDYDDEHLLMYVQNSASSDWHIQREKVLAEILEEKSKDSEFREELLSTDGRFLVYDTTPEHDLIYGQCMCPRCRGSVGQNLLGKALMNLRDKLIT